MQNSHDAMQLILDLGRASSECTKQTNSRHGGITKKATREERKAVIALFKALTGRTPSEEEISLATFG